MRALCVLAILAALSAAAPPSHAASSGDDGHGSGNAGSFVQMKPIVVSVFRNDGVVGKWSAVITLEVAGSAGVDAALAGRVRVRDAIIHELHRLAEREERTGREFSLDQIKRRMHVVSGRVLGPELVHDVLLQSLIRSGG